jgi:hypothetical protein
MAQAQFPDNVAPDIPPEKSPVEKIVEDALKALNDYFAGLEKVNDFAAAGRRVDFEH